MPGLLDQLSQFLGLARAQQGVGQSGQLFQGMYDQSYYGPQSGLTGAQMAGLNFGGMLGIGPGGGTMMNPLGGGFGMRQSFDLMQTMNVMGAFNNAPGVSAIQSSGSRQFMQMIGRAGSAAGLNAAQREDWGRAGQAMSEILHNPQIANFASQIPGMSSVMSALDPVWGVSSSAASMMRSQGMSYGQIQAVARDPAFMRNMAEAAGYNQEQNSDGSLQSYVAHNRYGFNYGFSASQRIQLAQKLAQSGLIDTNMMGMKSADAQITGANAADLIIKNTQDALPALANIRGMFGDVDAQTQVRLLRTLGGFGEQVADRANDLVARFSNVSYRTGISAEQLSNSVAAAVTSSRQTGSSSIEARKAVLSAYENSSSDAQAARRLFNNGGAGLDFDENVAGQAGMQLRQMAADSSVATRGAVALQMLGADPEKRAAALTGMAPGEARTALEKLSRGEALTVKEGRLFNNLDPTIAKAVAGVSDMDWQSAAMRMNDRTSQKMAMAATGGLSVLSAVNGQANDILTNNLIMSNTQSFAGNRATLAAIALSSNGDFDAASTEIQKQIDNDEMKATEGADMLDWIKKNKPSFSNGAIQTRAQLTNSRFSQDQINQTTVSALTVKERARRDTASELGKNIHEAMNTFDLANNPLQMAAKVMSGLINGGDITGALNQALGFVSRDEIAGLMANENVLDKLFTGADGKMVGANERSTRLKGMVGMLGDLSDGEKSNLEQLARQYKHGDTIGQGAIKQAIGDKLSQSDVLDLRKMQQEYKAADKNTRRDMIDVREQAGKFVVDGEEAGSAEDAKKKVKERRAALDTASGQLDVNKLGALRDTMANNQKSESLHSFGGEDAISLANGGALVVHEGRIQAKYRDSYKDLSKDQQLEAGSLVAAEQAKASKQKEVEQTKMVDAAAAMIGLEKNVPANLTDIKKLLQQLVSAANKDNPLWVPRG